MNSVRVLVADDSAAVRRLVSDTLSRSPGIQVVGSARNGREALTLLPQTRPDVILLDIEMPVMDGIQTLRQIRRHDKKTAVVIFSSVKNNSGAKAAEVKALGANEYVAKPVAAGNVDNAVRYIEAELIPRILHLGKRRLAAPLVTTRLEPQQHPAHVASRTTASLPTGGREGRQKNSAGPIDVVAIASSTGGPNALRDVLQALPQDLNVPVLIVQHMPKMFTKLLAERLNRSCRINVQQAYTGAVVRPGDVWIAPGDSHMIVERQGAEIKLATNDAPPENSCRPSADVLFRSVAHIFGGRSLAVILTGMGKDGLDGSRCMSKKGAFVIAQDERSSVVWGMPRAVTEAGVADKVMPLSDIGREIANHVRIGHPPRKLVGNP